MKVYIKRRSDFSIAAAPECTSFDLPLESIDDESGSAVLIDYNGGEYVDDWLYIKDKLVLITQASPDESKLTIDTKDPSYAFDRQCIWPNDAEATYGAFIKSALERDYLKCDDEVFRLPYLRITNSDTTPLTAPELDDTGLYVLSDIMLAARRSGVSIRFSITSTTKLADTLSVDISTKASGTHNVVFGDGRSALESETYSPNAVSKVTVLQEQSSETDDSETIRYNAYTLYLSDDGNVTSDPPAKRAEGKWEYVTCSADDDPLEAAVSKFSENLASHKIEFYSDRIYNLYDQVLLKLKDKTMTSRIVRISFSSDDSRYFYTCGELPTTLTEKVRSTDSGSSYVSPQSGGSAGYPVGMYILTSDPTSPAKRFGGTWEQIKGKFILAASETYASGTTGGEATHVLTTNEMPNHNHSFFRQQWYEGETLSNNGILSWASNTQSAGTASKGVWSADDMTGGGAAHNNMPPYIAAYCWHRIA